MDLNKLLEAVVGLHGAIERLRGDIVRAGVVPSSLPAGAPRGKRFGRVEVLMLATAEGIPDAGPHPTLEEFVAAVVAQLPSTQPGRRDTRRQVVLRAAQSLSRERLLRVYRSLRGHCVCPPSAPLKTVGLDVNGEEQLGPLTSDLI